MGLEAFFVLGVDFRGESGQCQAGYAASDDTTTALFSAVLFC